MAKTKVSRRKLLAGSWAAAALGMAPSAAAEGGPDRAEQPQGGTWERPPDQRDRGNRRNLILLNVDTFRADNLQCYGGNDLVHCPRLDRFAEDSVIFDDVYPEGMPTIPTRRVLWTGRRILPFSYYHQHEPVQLPGWHDLFYEDQTLAETLNEAAYHTVLIADIPHLQRPGRNFHRGYRYYEWLRGHEVDRPDRQVELQPGRRPRALPKRIQAAALQPGERPAGADECCGSRRITAPYWESKVSF